MSRKTRIELGRRADLGADCANCFGLCCVALAFARSADFAFDKPAGDPCVNLDDDDRCRIHPHLREQGFKGCTVFDCFGAGQKVSQHTFAGVGWREDDEVRRRMFDIFPLVRQLHELLWYLDAALALPAIGAIRGELERVFAETEAITLLDAEELLTVDVRAQLDAARPVLAEASRAARVSYSAQRGRPAKGKQPAPGADLLGARLRGQDLRGVDLRGAVLIAADLRGADLRGADLIGTDLRDAELAGADLSEALFLNQVQVNSARGDARTVLPPSLVMPTHWRSDADAPDG